MIAKAEFACAPSWTDRSQLGATPVVVVVQLELPSPAESFLAVT